MKPPLQFIQRTRSFFDRKHDYFYLLDLGSSSLKLALFEVDKQKKSGTVLEVAQESFRFPEAKKETSSSRQAHQAVNLALGTASHTFKRMRPSAKVKIQKGKLVIGLASDMVQGHTSSYLHKRDEPDTPVDVQEIKQVVHNAELKAYEEVRKKFVDESGYSDLDVMLVHPIIQEIKVDGHRVANPSGMGGKELQLVIFNAYVPSFYREIVAGLGKELNMTLQGVYYEPYALFHTLARHSQPDFDALVIDIGGKNTRISLVRKGRLEDIKTFAFGGASFTQRIARELRITAEEADQVKLRYSANELSTSARTALERALEPELSIFLRALEMILKEFSQASLLPGSIYVYGGGGNLPLIDAIIKKRNWKKNVSFLSVPKFHRIGSDIFTTEYAAATPCGPHLISLLALSDYTLWSATQKESQISRTLRRMAHIIQN